MTRNTLLASIGATALLSVSIAIATASADGSSTQAAANPVAPPTSPASSPAGDAPITAFSRAASADDTLPASVTEAIGRLGQTADATRRLAELSGSTVFVSRVHNDGLGICLEVVDQDEVSTSTCNGLEGVSRGWIHIGDGHHMFAVVDDSVTLVKVLDDDGKPIGSIVPHNNAVSIEETTHKQTAVLLGSDGTEQARIPMDPSRLRIQEAKAP
jgi:hypothetical protein